MPGPEGPQSEESQQEAELQSFRAEVAGLKAKEERRELPTVHLRDVNPVDLTDDDRAIWTNPQDGSLTPDTLRTYAAAFRDEERRQRKDIPQSRHEFLSFINNKAIVLFMRRRQEEEKKQQ